MKRRGPTKRKFEELSTQEQFKVKTFTKWPIILVSLICLVSFIVHVYAADYKRRQGALTFDEGMYLRLAFQLKNNQDYSTQNIYQDELARGRQLPSELNRPLYKHPPFFATMVSSFYVFLEQKTKYDFDELYLMASKVSNLMGCFLIFIVFLIGRKFFNVYVGLGAALLLALDLNLMICSSKVWMDSTLALLIWLSLYLFYKGIEQRGWLYLAGFVAGIALWTKYPAILIFPIVMTYVVLFESKLIKHKEFYFFFLIPFLMIIPWIKKNMDVYGINILDKVFVQIAGIDRVNIILGVILLVLVAVILIHFLKRVLKRGFTSDLKEQNTYRWIFFLIIGSLVGYLLIQKSFWTSIVGSLRLSSVPEAGWKMGLFDGQPWFFYIKQYIEYSPMYILFIIAILRAPFTSRSQWFLVIASFWVLIFGILWKNFQGRYILAFSPAICLLVSEVLISYFKYLFTQRPKFYQFLFLIAFTAVIYLTFRTIQIDFAIALKDNVAYF